MTSYVVDEIGDTILDILGNDSVSSSAISLNLINYGGVEHASLTGSAALNLTGTSANNTLTGNSGNNSLTGGGGTDTLIGGNGNDGYVIDDATDAVVETSTGGTADRVFSSTISLSLINYANVEHITLTGAAALNATGNNGSNIIIGNSAANTIFGSSGADTFTGGAGADAFIYTRVSDSASAIQDFFNDFNTAATDIINLSAIDAITGAWWGQ